MRRRPADPSRGRRRWRGRLVACRNYGALSAIRIRKYDPVRSAAGLDGRTSGALAKRLTARSCAAPPRGDHPCVVGWRKAPNLAATILTPLKDTGPLATGLYRKGRCRCLTSSAWDRETWRFFANFPPCLLALASWAWGTCVRRVSPNITNSLARKRKSRPCPNFPAKRPRCCAHASVSERRLKRRRGAYLYLVDAWRSALSSSASVLPPSPVMRWTSTT